MSDEIQRRLERLSPAKRELLEQHLGERPGARRGVSGPVPLEAGDGPFPLSFAQERFWFLERLEPANPAHHLPGVARLTGRLDVAVLHAALERVLERHEILRTVYEESDGVARQRVLPAFALDLDPEDLRGLAPAERESARARIEEQVIRAPFDLARGPVLRMRLLRLEDQVHELITCVHHIAADAVTMQLLGEEIAHAYPALLAGKEPDLPRLPVQYKDHAVWQRAQLSEQQLPSGVGWWTEQLRDLTQAELPTDHPRRGDLRALARRHGLDLPPALGARLRELARAEGTTLFVVLLSALQVLVRRWTGEHDLAIGTTTANRDRAEVERLAGFFVNTLVLRADLSGDPSFRELLARTSRASLAALEHQEVPFERVVEACEVERRLDVNPLFQVMFSHVELRELSRALGDELEMVYRPSQAGTPFDLTLFTTVHADSVRLEFEANSRLFEASTVRRLLAHLETFLFAAAADPDQLIGAISILPPEEQLALRAWSAGPRAEQDGALLLHSRFAERAALHPDRVAVRDDERALTFAEVDAAANRLARDLLARGVCPGRRVAITLERGAALLPALIGVARTGAAWVPVDPALPPARRELILADSAAEVVIDQVDLDSDADPGAPEVEVRPEDCAYLIYTSGSTGVPKGVRVPHRALVRLLDAIGGSPGLGEQDTLLAVTPLSFDISVLELLGPPLVGATVRIASAEDAGDGARLARLLDTEPIRVMQATPATWRMLLLAGWRGKQGLRILCGGDVLPRDLADELRRSGAELWNLYGPTETTVWSTAGRIDAGPITVGRPLAGEQVRVVDDRGRSSPIGVTGELWISGDGLALGYHDRDELTAQLFVEGPFADDDARRAYRTGDLARWRADGRLELLGRRDDQVKLRGHRIELGEVESVLRACAGVADAACALRGERLVAWVVGPCEANALRAHAAAHLPAAMVPAAFVTLDALPLSPAGKLDRRALAEPAPASSPRPKAATATERALTEIWAEVLELDAVGLQDDFFALGGHSLLATRLAARIRARLDVEVPLRRFFSAPTIAELAPLIEEAARETGRRAPSVGVVPGLRPAHLPLSFAQERLWFLDRLAPEAGAYVMPGAFRLRGPLDVVALRRSLEEVVRRHEVLRTVLRERRGAGEQVILDPCALELDPLDLTGEPDPEAAWRALATAAASRPFDLATGPLLRLDLARLGEEHFVLLVVLHHVVADGWSVGVLVREVARLYPAMRAGEPSPLSDLALQYADHTLWQREHMAGSLLTEELQWWRDTLEGAPTTLALPTDHPRPALQGHAGARLHLSLSESRATRLRALAGAQGASTFHVLLAGFQLLLARLCGQDDLLVGTTVAGRDRPESEPLIGMFVNSLALRGRVDAGRTFVSHLKDTRDAALAALDHGALPFEKLVEELAPPRDLSRQPLFQVTLDLLNAPSGDLELPDLSIEELAVDLQRSKFDLSLLFADDASLSCTLEFDTALFETETVSQWWRCLEVLLDAACADPERPCGDLPLLDEAARDQALAAAVAEASAYPADGLLHEAFEAIAAANPESIAVRGPDFDLTYGEVEARSNHLAHLLRDAGHDPGATVGVCLDHGVELVPALLAVLKAGCAYLPLDPAYPRARLERILEDARVGVVLTDGATAAGFPERAPTLRVDEVRGRAPAPPSCGVTPDDLAYVIYTSGSTGAPKGVEVSHAAAAHYVERARSLYAVERGEGAPLCTSIGFDLTITSLFPVLAAGRTVTLVPPGDGVGALADSARAHPGQSLVKLTPSHLRALEVELTPSEAAAWTRVLVVGGEALSFEDLAFWRRIAPDTRIVNEYGPTEATVGCVVYEVRDDDPPTGPVPIGRPLPNLRAYLLDGRGEPTPPGVPGELFLAGPCLARGYRGLAEETAERFCDDPFGAGRMYRTGDRARMLPGGDLAFLGRLDGQVKVRGHRIEPAEIEAALRRGGARAASVGLREGRLIAWVECAAEQVSALRESLARDLPAAFQPGAIVAMDALPLTAHGKLDAAALPEPTRASTGAKAPLQPARGSREQRLASAMVQVLGLDRVGRDDDFFSLGGDSILSIALVARAAEAGLHLRTRDVFEHPTVAGLAAVAATSAAAPSEERLEGETPLLPSQRWLLERGLAAPQRWNQSLVLEARSDLTPTALKRAVLDLVEHHDALRTRFEHEAGQWRARVHAESGVELVVLPGEADEDSLDQAQDGFDLARGPLMRLTWFERGEDQPAHVVWSAHHLLVDGVSWRILLEDLARLLDGEGPLPRRTGSVRSFASAIEDIAPREPDRRSVGAFPLDGEGDNLEGDARSIRVVLDEDTTTALLSSAPRAWRTTPEDLLVAALGAELAAETGCDAALIDVEGHGRAEHLADLDLSRTVGWFTSIRPVRVEPGDEPATLIRGTKEALRAERDSPQARNCAEVLFNYLGQTDVGAAQEPPLRPIDLDPGAVKGQANARAHLLELDARAQGGRLRMDWRFAAQLIDEARVRRLAQRVQARIEALIAVCAAQGAGGLTPSDVPLAGLDQASLDALGPGVEEIFPLTPTQQGMFFHALYEPGAIAYFEQLACVLEGDLDLAGLREAYAVVTASVELLRARVIWRGLPRPLFVVQREVELPWRELDWSERTPRRAREDLNSLCEQERARGFDLEIAPLFSLVVVRMPAGRHAVVFSYHHLILDGWSMPIVLERVLSAYRGGGAPAETAPAYREFVSWLEAQDEQAARRFWRERLAGFERRTPVGPRSDVPESGEYGEREISLTRVETAQVVALARSRGLTLSTLVQAAWALVLGRSAGERDVVFGATVAGRPAALPRIERAVGLFINTLVVRARLDDDARVEDWLRDLQARRAEESTFEWTPLPLAAACSDVAPGEALFESLVVFENYPLDQALRSAPGGLHLVETLAFERTSYPLTLVGVPGESLALRVLFDLARLDAAEAEALLERVRTALGALAAAPTARLGDVGVLAPAERQEVLFELPGGPPSPVEAPLVHRAILDQAAAAPERVAIEQGEVRWSYAKLAERVEGLAGRLAARGVGPEVVVGVQLERSPEFVAALLGVLRAGGAFLPLDPDLPPARRARLCTDAGAGLVVTTAELSLGVNEIEELVFDEVHDSSPAPADAALGEHLAYVLFTSGSTGAPRGVAVEHRSIAHYAAVARELYGLTASDRALQLAALGFDTCLEEILPTLACGATLVLRDEDTLSAPQSFARWVGERGITLLNFPTALWNEVVSGLDGACAEALAGVRGVIIGGETLRAEQLARWRELFGEQTSLWNTYGPTEATIVSTVADLTAPLRAPVPERPPIGRPIPGARVFVVDEALRPVPCGAAGELAIGGMGVARGYLGRDEDTRARFPLDPFPGAGPGARLFLSGDRVRFRADGELEFLGRLDQQVKVRGHRVEPGELEHVLAAHPEIAEALVCARSDSAGRVSLAARVRPIEGAAPEPAALTAWLEQRLPAPLIPVRIDAVEALPRTPSGKLDRAAWADAETFAPRGEAPSTAQEEAACALFAAALEVEQVGVDDDFFALGGDSLVAVALMGRAERDFGLELSLRDLFEQPTPRALAGVLARREGEDPGQPDQADIDLVSEARLPADLVPATGAAVEPPRKLLLTGATGFLGTHLLAELLDQTDAEVVALVRAEDDATARRRLLDGLERFGLPARDPGARLSVQRGDLAAARLGMTEEAFQRLAEELDAVFHAGASTHFLRPYASLRGPNVAGTLEALRLCCEGRPKAFHHVSTVGVFDVEDPPAVIHEDLDLADFRAVRGGYAQTKWVAEGLVRAAGERGLSTRIYRPGRIVASARTGIASEGDVTLALMRLCVELGSVPDLDLEFDAVPVDHVASALVGLALQPSTAGGNFHLIHPARLSARETAEQLQALGHAVTVTAPQEWWRAVEARVSPDPTHPLFPLLGLLAGTPELTGVRTAAPPRLDDVRAREALSGSGIVPAVLDAAFLRRVVAGPGYAGS